MLRTTTTEYESLNLDNQLREAAASGTAEEVRLLLENGASITAKDSQGRTALHWAVLQDRTENMSVLLEHGASLFAVDEFNKSVAAYAAESSHAEVQKFSTLFNPLADETVIDLVLPHLTLKEALQLQQVNTLLSAHYKHHEDLALKPLEKFESIFEKLSIYFKYIILNRLHRGEDIQQIRFLFLLLEMPASARKKAYEEKTSTTLVDSPGELMDAHVFLLVLGIASPTQCFYDLRLLNPCIIYMLDEKLLTIANMAFFQHSIGEGWIEESLPTLEELACPNGIKALRQGLLKIKDAPFLQDLPGILSTEGFAFLQEELISSSLIAAMCQHLPHFQMSMLVQPEFVALLRQKRLSFKDLSPKNAEHVNKAVTIYKSIPLLTSSSFEPLLQGNLIPITEFLFLKNLKITCVEFAERIIKEKLVPGDQLSKMPAAIFSENGVEALKKGLIPWQDIILHKKLNTNLVYLLSGQGWLAFKEGVISLEDAKLYSLAILRFPNALLALKNKLITLKQASRFHQYGQLFQANSLGVILSDIGIAALKEGIISPEQAALFHHSGLKTGPQDNLDVLLNPVGIIALRKKLIRPKDASVIFELHKLLDVNNPQIITAMELGLIKPEDFIFGAKYSYWGNGPKITDWPTHTKKLIERYYVELDKTKRAMAKQKIWRGHVARNHYGLFSDFDTLLTSGNTEMHKIEQTLKLIKKGKTQNPKVQLENIRRLNK